MFWGLSSALDLWEEYLNAFKVVQPGDGDQEELKENEKDDPLPDQVRILICGGGDPRHVIKTLAKRYKYGNKPQLDIYLIDACMEIAARNILLLGIALESADTFNLINKVHLFMDIYGNTVLRPSSYHYMAAKSRAFLKIISDDEELQKLAPMLNIDTLKHKERDGLEMAFTFWQPKATHLYSIDQYWERRLRILLRNRYDHREGAFDWDLNMVLKEREGQQICSQEYRYWRECGIAFVFPEYEHCKPNKTFAAGLVRNGQTFSHRGYVGDIQTGPFCGFGLRTTEERMHHSQHGDNDYRATDITERNLLELFHELQTNSVYEHDTTRSRRYGSVKLLMGARLSCDDTEEGAQEDYNKPWIEVPGVRVHFISSVEIVGMQNGAPRWNEFFDIAYVGHNYFPFIKNGFLNFLKSKSLFLLETKLLTVDRREHVNSFESKAKDLCKLACLQPVINYQAINAKNMVLKYKKVTNDKEIEKVPVTSI